MTTSGRETPTPQQIARTAENIRRKKEPPQEKLFVARHMARYFAATVPGFISEDFVMAAIGLSDGPSGERQ